MTTKEALAYYDNDPRRLAAALGIWHSAVYQWGEYPPALRQLQLQHLTQGVLSAEPDAFVGGDNDDNA